jgi:AraC family transcriptional regulator
MTVTYRSCIEERGEEQVCEQIQILIPGDQGTFDVISGTADGPRHRACVRGHHVSVIPGNQPHAISCQRQADMVVIGLQRAFFEEKAREALDCAAPRLVERYAAVDPFLRAVANTLRSEFRMQRNPSPAYLESLAGVVAIHLARNYCDGAAMTHPERGLAPHKLNRVQAFIQAHVSEGIRVSQLAEIVHMSLYHFARMFKLATGQPPHLYITIQRIEHAKALLRDSSLPLVVVAARVGFQTQEHFTNVFHRYAGVTPRVYRLSCRSARAVPTPTAAREWASV